MYLFYCFNSAMDNPAFPDEEAVQRVLRRVVDPEVGANIVDLGLIYDLRLTPERVDVVMTMTSPACPMGEMIMDEVRHELTALLPSSCAVEVELVWSPPWTPERMSPECRQRLGWTEG